MDRYPLKTFAHYLNQPFTEDSFSGALRAVLKAVDHNGQLPKVQRRGSYKAVLDEARGKLKQRAKAGKLNALEKRKRLAFLDALDQALSQYAKAKQQLARIQQEQSASQRARLPQRGQEAAA